MTNKLQLTVNEMEYTDNTDRKKMPCNGCKVPTTGRVEKKPYCLDCAMKSVFSPIRKALEGFHD